MFLSDISSTNNRGGGRIIDGLGLDLLTDQIDPEIRNLYVQSPIIYEWSSSYIPESKTTNNSSSSIENSTTKNFFNQSNGKPQPIVFEERKINPIFPIYKKKEKINKIQRLEIDNNNDNNDEIDLHDVIFTEIEEEDDENSPAYVSNLTSLLDETRKKAQASGVLAGSQAVIVYLPDVSSLLLYAPENITCEKLIELILEKHKNSNIHPQLEYDHPELYCLRVHESDGEPDTDFAPLEPSKPFSNYGLNEVCLVDCIDDDNSDGIPAIGESLFQATKNSSNFGFPSMNDFTRVDRSTMNGYRPSNRYSNYYDMLEEVSSSNNFEDYDLYDLNSPDEKDGIFEDKVTIYIKINETQTESITLPINRETTLHSLLPQIHKNFRIQIYTDEFVFVVTDKQMKALKLANNIVDSDIPISEIGVYSFELQKKILLDSVKLERTQANKNYHENLKLISQTEQYTQEYETSYKEWNVIKKNKFGKKQERIFGIKGRTIYNGKRNQPPPVGVTTGGSQNPSLLTSLNNVQRAERDISNINNLEKSPTDPKSFIITWRDNNDIYRLEYFCETKSDLDDIYARLEFLHNKYNKKKY